ncbi:NAD-P-binding protein [Lactarius psammicola]|nr:NAD-P-binding protein [Lactarius psammicola]
MSGYKNFAVVGAGEIGSFIIRQLLTDKAAGIINDVVVLTRQARPCICRSNAHTDQLSQGSKTTVDPAAKLIPVDYSNKESIKIALTGVDVVISTVALAALNLQPGIAEAAKEVGPLTIKASIQEQLKAIGIPYALFWTGSLRRISYGSRPTILMFSSGKVSVGGDGSNLIPFTSRPDIARYLSYVLTHLPADQLESRSFAIRGDTKSNGNSKHRISRSTKYSRNTKRRLGKKVAVTYIPVSELNARLASNPQDIVASLHKIWATPYHPETDNHLYPDWNPSSGG